MAISQARHAWSLGMGSAAVYCLQPSLAAAALGSRTIHAMVLEEATVLDGDASCRRSSQEATGLFKVGGCPPQSLAAGPYRPG